MSRTRAERREAASGMKRCVKHYYGGRLGTEGIPRQVGVHACTPHRVTQDRCGGPRPGFGGKQPGAGRKAGPVDGPRSVVLDADTVRRIDELRGPTPRAQLIRERVAELEVTDAPR